MSVPSPFSTDSFSFLGLVGGPGACFPENFEKIVFRIG